MILVLRYRFFLKLKCSPRMNELFQNFDIVISDNNMDIRNLLVLFASGTAGYETSIGLKRSSL
jgi:sulfur relay (sulfurtransferase) DsrC/TusE family protein